VNQRLKLGLVLAAGIAVISSASILIRWAQDEGVPSIVIAAYRLTVATCILSIPMARQRGWRDYAKLNTQTATLLVLSGVLLGLHFATWITSLAHVSVMSSVVLVCTTPIWIGLASPWVLGERISRLMWISLLITMTGASVIGLAGWQGAHTQTLSGAALALAGAIFGAGYLVIGRRVRANTAFIPYLWVVYGTAAVFLLAWSLTAGMPLTGYTLSATLCMVALGIGPQLIGHSAANYALRHLSATFVSLAILGEPIGSTVLAAVFLQEHPSQFQMLGGVLTLAGIAAASWVEARTAPQVPK
jgi:drug/metabolite transporter (DMT)-like permease